MGEMINPECLPPSPPFASFYEAVNGYEPFPWQSRLASRLETGAGLPTEVGIPTGLGKTSCLDIAIWWLASQAHRPPPERTAPTRIWWVVNRRLLVDSTHEHAERIRKMLAKAVGEATDNPATPDPLRSVALRLRSLAVDSNAAPLDVIRLRGGVAWRRPTDPSQPAIVLSTIPMYGSRLLFRGYGSSRSMRPVDAALAGTDSLVLVDEAHLARHLMRLFPALHDCAPARRSLLNPSRATPNVVALTATGDADGERLELDEADKEHPEIRKRLHAEKPTQVRVSDKPDQVRPLAEAASSLLSEAAEPSTCVVFVNSPKTARAVKKHLGKEMRRSPVGVDIVVLTGQAREREAEESRTRILDGMGVGRGVEGRSRHLVVVATQTLEVGADIDAEFLVTEACGVRALTQRLGRLNRLGLHPHARAIYVHCPPERARGDGGWPVYGTEPQDVLERLESAIGVREEVDLAPAHIASVLGEPGDDPGRAPEILPALLWEWTKTTTPPAGEAPVEPYFSGIAQPDRSVSLIWRVHVPGGGERLWPKPKEREFVDVPIGEFRQAIADEEDLRRLGSDGITVEEVRSGELRPGDQVVVRTDRGLLDTDGWAPESDASVLDVSLLSSGLPLDAEALGRLCNVPADKFEKSVSTVAGDIEDGEYDESLREDALEDLLGTLRSCPPSGFTDSDYRDAELEDWDDFVSRLDGSLGLTTVRGEVARLRRSLIDGVLRIDELDEMSLADVATDLDGHGRDVGSRAGRVAEAVGLPPDLTEIISRAGRFHDVGKADTRFQRWLDPGRTGATAAPPIAKSDMPRSRWAAAQTEAGWPRGGRHEDLSARLVREWLSTTNGRTSEDVADLLVHLVISHHGKARPLVPPVEDGTPERVCYELEGIEVSCSADLSDTDWTQPARFKRLNDLYGPWGLALLEAIVRQADHAVSAGAQVRDLEVR
jgi:CRISPR-associated endonuclease/helicase Cas3